jgi:serine/threonine-protein kinase
VIIRLAWDYWTGLIITATLVVGHATIVGCELTGVLRPMSLLVGSAGAMYESPRLAILIWSSVLWVFMFGFFGTNAAVNQIRQKDIALAEARRDAARAVHRSGQGRLTGQTMIGKYELGQLLGRGGMGEIYRARRLSDAADVAIKVLHPHLLADQQAVERFRREAEAASRVAIDRVPRVLDGGATDSGEPFLVMEYLSGENLAERLHLRGRLDLGEVTHLVEQIAAVLDVVHAAGIVHRDLKPQNVFLADDGRVMLLDFGISKMKTADTTLTEDADVLGSPGYMAPEQARGHVEQVGPATDVFALGAIAYRALTGRPAFAAADVVAALYQVCNAEPTPPSSMSPAIPPAVDTALARAMAKDPANRFERASKFAHALVAAVGPNAVMMRQGGRGT